MSFALPGWHNTGVQRMAPRVTPLAAPAPWRVIATADAVVRRRRVGGAIRTCGVRRTFTRLGVLALVLSLLPLVSTRCARANGPEVISTGATLIPVKSTAVRLEFESVHVDLPVPFASRGRVECKYHLHNVSANTVAFSMAFVAGEAGSPFGDVAQTFRDSRFRVVADWRELPSRMQAIEPEDWSVFVDNPPDSLRVWEFAMPPNGYSMLQISYDVWPSPAPSDAGTVWRFKYNARPASLWLDTIAAAEITFTLGALGGPLLKCLLQESVCVTANVTPHGYAWTEQGIKWTFHDWEPDTDFEVDLVVPEAKP